MGDNSFCDKLVLSKGSNIEVGSHVHALWHAQLRLVPFPKLSHKTWDKITTKLTGQRSAFVFQCRPAILESISELIFSTLSYDC